MDAISLVLLLTLYVAMLLVVSFKPQQGTLSDFEKNRLLKNKTSAAKIESERDKFFGATLGLRFMLMTLVMFFIVMLLVDQLHWLVAFLLFIVGVVSQLVLVGSGIVQKLADKLYSKLEVQIFRVFHKYPKVAELFARLPLPSQKPRRIYSKEEMLHIASESTGVLTAKEIKRIQKSLAFSEVTVESIMTPRSVVETVAADDLLGPLRLDELHKTGYSRFPVVEEDIDHIIGVVYIRNLLELVDKHSKKARDIMDSPVHYIKETQTLEHALAAFLKTRHHLFVVVNEFRETVGIITLEDVIEQLIGERILDQFDQHDDLRVVATRNLKANNQPKKYKDIAD